jgi:hypothetical protein
MGKMVKGSLILTQTKCLSSKSFGLVIKNWHTYILESQIAKNHFNYKHMNFRYFEQNICFTTSFH